MNLYKVGFTLLLFNACALADDYAERLKLLGVWESQDTSGKSRTWTIEAKGENLHISYAEGSQKLADFECSTAGKECKTKAFGHDSTVLLYFNGAELVEMETHGSDVVKRRFGAAGAGDQLEVEYMPLSPSGKTETQQYKRAQLAAAQPR